MGGERQRYNGKELRKRTAEEKREAHNDVSEGAMQTRRNNERREWVRDDKDYKEKPGKQRNGWRE